MSEFSYSDRYGQVPTRWKPLAVTLLIIGGAWLLWAGLHHSRPAISASLISFSVSSDREVSIRYSLMLTSRSEETEKEISDADIAGRE